MLKIHHGGILMGWINHCPGQPEIAVLVIFYTLVCLGLCIVLPIHEQVHPWRWSTIRSFLFYWSLIWACFHTLIIRQCVMTFISFGGMVVLKWAMGSSHLHAPRQNTVYVISFLTFCTATGISYLPWWYILLVFNSDFTTEMHVSHIFWTLNTTSGNCKRGQHAMKGRWGEVYYCMGGGRETDNANGWSSLLYSPGDLSSVSKIKQYQ